MPETVIPSQAITMSAAEIRRLPPERRDAILAAMAARAGNDSLTDPELTAFEAFGEVAQDGPWVPFDGGSTVGRAGSEGGLILRDEEHPSGARTPLERDCSHGIPFSVTCGVYGWFFHTRFLRTEAEAEWTVMRDGLAAILDIIPYEDDPDCDAKMEAVGDVIGKFAARFPRMWQTTWPRAPRALHTSLALAATSSRSCITEERSTAVDPVKHLAPHDVGKKARSLFDEFKDFALRGNVMDLAVGVIIGTAFGKIIDSLVKNVIMPLVGVLTPGSQGYLGWKWVIDGKEVPYGLFLGEVVNFLIVALALYVFVVKFLGLVKAKKDDAPPAPTKDQELLTEIRDLLKRKPA